MITNPGASRTLDPAKRSLVSIVGIHDRKLADSDFNLAQSLGDHKRRNVLHNHVSSGALSYKPFQFSAGTTSATALNFTVPAFDVLVNGEVVSIGGNASATNLSNVVTLPAPLFWSPGSSAPAASIYSVFIEFWYQRVNAATGMGYYVDPTTSALFFYPNGCVNALAANMIPNDSIDVFSGSQTTERVQLQWAIRVQSLDLGYDFTKYAFGLDAGATPGQTVFAQALQPEAQTTAPFQFVNMGPINGDAGLWRSGDGMAPGNLNTLDGYSYALPLAVVFQRNTGAYDPEHNPFGTATATSASSGLLATGLTGRFDGKFADVIFPADVVDTRSVISLSGWEESDLIRDGFTDIITGKTRTAIARGEVPGNLATALGSLLDYTITLSPYSAGNTDNVGAFDGYRNGFSSADQIFYTSKSVTVDQKTVGNIGSPWAVGDAFTVQLPNSSKGTISYLQVQGLFSDPISSAKTPVLYLAGQVTVTGIGTRTVTVTFAKDLTGTTYSPGLNPLYAMIGVEYPANGGMDLVQTPEKVFGGSLIDTTSGQTMPVYGISDYDVTTTLPIVSAASASIFNPNYSDLTFGTRVQILVAASTGVSSTTSAGNTITTFSLTRLGLNGTLTGLYVIGATNSASGAAYTVVSRAIFGNNFTLQLQGTVTGSLLVNFLVMNTAQMSYNAPVRAVTMIQETVLAGRVTDGVFRMDPRITVASVKNLNGVSNLLVLATTGGTLSGVSGDDVNKLIWVKDTTGNYNAVVVSSVVFANSFVTLTVPSTVNLEVQDFFVAAALLPAFSTDSVLTVAQNYIPYQGEGVTTRDYEIIHTENTALVTTNGTGAVPIPGLKDIYPYDRELPISTSLPSQATWSDATLLNQPVASFFDSNYEGKAFENVEHTFEVPVHTNDFIEPFHDGKRKSFRLSTASGGRGYAKAVPHLGFAIRALTAKNVSTESVTSTAGSITIYVDNVHGNDANDGLAIDTAFHSIGAALASLPSVLRHPVSVQLVPTSTSFSIASLSSQLKVATGGDGVIQSAKHYALGVLCFGIQDAGRLVITSQAGTTGRVTIDASEWAGFGDGPTSAFYIQNTRVLFNQIEFANFTDPAIKGIDASVSFVDCAFTDNQQAASFEQNCSVVLSAGIITLAAGSVGLVLSGSSLDASQSVLAAPTGGAVGPYFVAERGSSLVLSDHTPAFESRITATTLIAQAELNSSIETDSTFTSLGLASVSTNSVILTGVSTTPFSGGVLCDASSTVTTSP